MAEGATRIEFRCSPYHQNSAFYPIIEHLQRLLQFHVRIRPLAKLEKLRHTLEPLSVPPGGHPAFVGCLALAPPSGGYSAPDAEPAEAEAEDAGSLGSLAGGGSGTAGRVLCLGRPALGGSLHAGSAYPLPGPGTHHAAAALLTFRPEFTPPWRPARISPSSRSTA